MRRSRGARAVALVVAEGREPSTRLAWSPAAWATAAEAALSPLVLAAGVHVDVGVAEHHGHRLGAGGSEGHELAVEARASWCASVGGAAAGDHDADRPLGALRHHLGRIGARVQPMAGAPRRRPSRHRRWPSATCTAIAAPVLAELQVPSSGSTIHQRGLSSRRRSSRPSSERIASPGASAWRRSQQQVVGLGVALVAPVEPRGVVEPSDSAAAARRRAAGGGSWTSGSGPRGRHRRRPEPPGARDGLLTCWAGFYPDAPLWPATTYELTHLRALEGRGDPHHPRGRRGVGAPGAAVLRRQGLDRDAAAGREGVRAGRRCPFPVHARRHRAQLPRGARLPRPAGSSTSACGSWSRACRTSSTRAGSSRTREPEPARNRLQTVTLLRRRSRRTASTPRSAAAAATRRRPGPRSGSSRFRDDFGQWDPKNQRPELWSLYNGAHQGAASTSACSRCRTGPSSTSGSTSRRGGIELPSIYFAHERAGVPARRHAAMDDIRD